MTQHTTRPSPKTRQLRGSEAKPINKAPRPVRTATEGLLGALSVDDFLRRHWQRRPLLVRQAVRDGAAPLDVQSLCDLAAHDGVESRLITAFNGRWLLEHGPFQSEDLPSLNRKRWTLLVQGVDLHVQAAHQLLSRFRFLPDARLDDLMISLASDQGGVGPHVDSYDVFLLQAWGRRRWRIAPPGDNRLIDGLPLKILDRFEPTEEWILEPGDMLYLPPGWQHDGMAQGPCMTCSIGFRAPSRHEFLREFLAQAADQPGGPDPRFSDAGRPPSRNPARLPADMAAGLEAWASQWRPARADIERFIGCYLTEPKPTVWFEAHQVLSRRSFALRVVKRGLHVDPRSRILYRSRLLFLNGEAFELPRRGAGLLRRLADRRALSPLECQTLLADADCAELVYGWFNDAWIGMGETMSPESSQL
jgi:50S ribosomal protein L16 3-hydroxylase